MENWGKGEWIICDCQRTWCINQSRRTVTTRNILSLFVRSCRNIWQVSSWFVSQSSKPMSQWIDSTSTGIICKWLITNNRIRRPLLNWVYEWVALICNRKLEFPIWSNYKSSHILSLKHILETYLLLVIISVVVNCSFIRMSFASIVFHIYLPLLLRWGKLVKLQ